MNIENFAQRKSLSRSRQGLPFRVTQTFSGNPGVWSLWHHHHLLMDTLNALLRVPLFLKKSGAKNFGCRKMAKNYGAILSPTNSPPETFKFKFLRARTTLAIFLQAERRNRSIIFLTPFFWGRSPSVQVILRLFNSAFNAKSYECLFTLCVSPTQIVYLSNLNYRTPAP